MAKPNITVNANSSAASSGAGNLSVFDSGVFTTKCNVESGAGTGAVSFSADPVQLSVGATEINGWLPVLVDTDYFRADTFGTNRGWFLKNSSTAARPDSFERRYAAPIRVKAGTIMKSVLFESLLNQVSNNRPEHTLTLRAGFINQDGTTQQLGETVITGSDIAIATSYLVDGVDIVAATDSYAYIEIDLDDGGSTDGANSVIAFSNIAGAALVNFYIV